MWNHIVDKLLTNFSFNCAVKILVLMVAGYLSIRKIEHKLLLFCTAVLDMARGQQKIQSQQKAAEKNAKAKKQQGHNAADQKKAALKALVYVCAVCKV